MSKPYKVVVSPFPTSTITKYRRSVSKILPNPESGRSSSPTSLIQHILSLLPPPFHPNNTKLLEGRDSGQHSDGDDGPDRQDNGMSWLRIKKDELRYRYRVKYIVEKSTCVVIMMTMITIIREAMLTAEKPSWLSKLPTELIDMISGGNDGAMSRAEAEAYRLELMDERDRFIEDSDSDDSDSEFSM